MAGPQQRLRIIVGGTALATGETRIKNIVNVYDLYRTTSAGAPSKTGIMTQFKTSILTPLAACLSVSYVKSYMEARWIDDLFDPFTLVSDGVNGTVVNDSLPSVNNVVMQLKTGVRGRRARGFKYYGPIAESHTTLDYLNSTAIALWATFQAAYLAGATTGGDTWLPYLVSPASSNFKSDPPSIVGRPITSTIVNAPLTRKTSRWQLRRSSV